MTIEIHRRLLNRRAWRWLYGYSVDGGAVFSHDTHLASTAGFLKRTYPDAVIIKKWNNSKKLVVA